MTSNQTKPGDFNESWKEDELWVLDRHNLLESCDTILELKGKKIPLMILAIDYDDSHSSSSLSLWQTEIIVSQLLP
jgi:hypothetical protein